MFVDPNGFRDDLVAAEIAFLLMLGLVLGLCYFIR